MIGLKAVALVAVYWLQLMMQQAACVAYILNHQKQQRAISN